MSVDPSVLDEVSQFDHDYNPHAAQRQGLEVLADGKYDLQIVDAVLGRTPEKQQVIFRLTLKVLAGPSGIGLTVERVNFFTSQNNVNFLGADLMALGFDADQWTIANGRPFGRELAHVVDRLHSLRFTGLKSTTVQPGRNGQPSATYHNLRVIGRLYGSTPPPSAPLPWSNHSAERAGARTGTNPFDTSTSQDEEDIPF